MKYCKLASEESYGVLNTFQGKRVLLNIVFQSSQETSDNLFFISTYASHNKLDKVPTF